MTVAREGHKMRFHDCRLGVSLFKCVLRMIFKCQFEWQPTTAGGGGASGERRSLWAQREQQGTGGHSCQRAFPETSARVGKATTLLQLPPGDLSPSADWWKSLWWQVTLAEGGAVSLSARVKPANSRVWLSLLSWRNTEGVRRYTIWQSDWQLLQCHSDVLANVNRDASESFVQLILAVFKGPPSSRRCIDALCQMEMWLNHNTFWKTLCPAAPVAGKKKNKLITLSQKKSVLWFYFPRCNLKTLVRIFSLNLYLIAQILNKSEGKKRKEKKSEGWTALRRDTTEHCRSTLNIWCVAEIKSYMLTQGRQRHSDMSDTRGREAKAGVSQPCS